MNSHSLAFLPVFLVLSCGDKDTVVRDSDDSNDSNDSSGPDGEFLFGGDAGFTELADSCEEYARVDVSGSVSLDSSEASDLSSVDCLGSVSGDLVIDGDALTEVDLPNLDQVGGDLVVTEMASLETLNMDALMSVGGSIQVQANEYLQVASWSEICDVGASIAIELNLNLQQVDLGSNAVMNELGEALVVGDAIIITENPALQTLALSMLTGVNTFNEASARSSGAKGVGVVFEMNDSLETLDLSGLMGLAAPLKILTNASLTTINIQKTSMIGGDLLIASNPELLSLDFSQMVKVEGNLKLSENPKLTSRPEDFPSLEVIEGDLELEYLTTYYDPAFPLLEQVDGKINLHTVGVGDKSAVQSEETSFSVQLPLLNSVADEIVFRNIGARGLDIHSLESAPSDVSFIENPHLARLELAGSLNWNGSLIMSGNLALETLDAFLGLQTLGGGLEITYNQTLGSVNGLREVTDLRTKETEKDTACPGLETAILICGNPELTYEDACETVAQLQGATTASWDAFVYEGNECPEECPETDHAYGQADGQICHSENLDDDGDGYSEREDDCDDEDGSTFPGAAHEEENSEQCMSDQDEDGWGNCSPENGNVIPGTDCDDTDASTFPGAAEEESGEICMTDFDEDGYGDCSVEDGVEAGSDCDDEDVASEVDCDDDCPDD